ncbi:unnamed protein product, partial [Amoebophrya sp. A25]
LFQVNTCTDFTTCETATNVSICLVLAHEATLTLLRLRTKAKLLNKVKTLHLQLPQQHKTIVSCSTVIISTSTTATILAEAVAVVQDQQQQQQGATSSTTNGDRLQKGEGLEQYSCKGGQIRSN